jgi:hypothetical protein
MTNEEKSELAAIANDAGRAAEERQDALDALAAADLAADDLAADDLAADDLAADDLAADEPNPDEEGPL